MCLWEMCSRRCRRLVQASSCGKPAPLANRAEKVARSSQGLWVFLHGEAVGVAVRSRRAVHFMYRSDYPVSATPLSLSLPVDGRVRDISPWIDGLLPDNQRTRSRWAQAHGAASTDPFDLLSTPAGLECAGAVQFCAQQALPDSGTGELVELTDSEVADRLRDIMQDAEDAPTQGLGELRLSLAGAQPKMALRLTGDGWRLPTGALATTHILKPQRGHLNPALRDSMAVNEHLCQAAAVTLGLDAAPTSLEVFGDETCLVTERFDRRWDEGALVRCHFEDLCQALGHAPDRRYQSDGGPTPEQIIALLSNETGRGDARRFFLSLFYNWLIGNTDGHAKNYGVLLDGPLPRLAPLYDLSSAAPYAAPSAGLRPPAMRFAEPSPTTVQRWSQAAGQLGIGVADDELQDMAQALPEAFESAVLQCPEWASDTAQRISASVVAHAREATEGTNTGPAFVGSGNDGPLSAPSAPDKTETCGKTVKSTRKPCLLRRGHRGNCRSVL